MLANYGRWICWSPSRFDCMRNLHDSVWECHRHTQWLYAPVLLEETSHVSKPFVRAIAPAVAPSDPQQWNRGSLANSENRETPLCHWTLHWSSKSQWHRWFGCDCYSPNIRGPQEQCHQWDHWTWRQAGRLWGCGCFTLAGMILQWCSVYVGCLRHFSVLALWMGIANQNGTWSLCWRTVSPITQNRRKCHSLSRLSCLANASSIWLVRSFCILATNVQVLDGRNW